jgi:hypothetical protein
MPWGGGLFSLLERVSNRRMPQGGGQGLLPPKPVPITYLSVKRGGAVGGRGSEVCAPLTVHGNAI